MRNRLAATLLIIVLTAFVSAASAAEDQTLTLSKKVKGYNSQMAMAVNTLNGDVAVVWQRTNAKKNITGEIWMTLLQKNKKTDEYEIAEKKKLSDGEGPSFHPTIVFDEKNNQYAVSWVSSDPDLAGPSPAGMHPNNIKVMILNYLGAILYQRSVVAAVALQHYSNVLLHVVAANMDKPDKRARYLMAYSAQGVAGGLFLAWLDALGRIIGEPLHAMMGRQYGGQYYGIYPNSIVATLAGLYLIGVSHQVPQGNYWTYTAGLLMVTALGSVLHDTMLEKGYGENVRVLQLASALFMVAWMSGSHGGYVMQLFDADLLSLGAAFMPMKSNIYLYYFLMMAVAGKFYFMGTPFYDNQAPTADLDPAVNQLIYSRKFNSKGKLRGKDKALYLYGGTMRGLIGAPIPPAGNNVSGSPGKWPVMLIWIKEKNFSKSNIIATVLN